jgi:hypothetical protein
MKHTHTIRILAKRAALANPGCSCGGVSCNPSLTMDEAVEDLKEYLEAKGYSADVALVDPSDEQCPDDMRALAESHDGLLPLTLIDGEVSLYAGVRNEMVEKKLLEKTAL